MGILFCSLVVSILKTEQSWRLSKIVFLSDSGIQDEISRWSDDIIKTPAPISVSSKHYLHGGVALRNFNYIIENRILCLNNSELSYFIYIYTSPGEFEERKRIRETWGRSNILNYNHAKMAFFLGRTVDRGVMSRVKQESRVHADIVQADFIDSYTNLTLKSVLTLEWMNVHCNSARYYVKVDSAVLLDTFRLMTSIDRHLRHAQRAFLCHVWWRRLVNRWPGKWQVPRDQYWPIYYPPYCNGPLWVFTADLLTPLYSATFCVPFVNIEDAYTSGLLPLIVGYTQHIDAGSLVDPTPRGVELDRYKFRRVPVASEPAPHIYREAWGTLVERLTANEKRLLT